MHAAYLSLFFSSFFLFLQNCVPESSIVLLWTIYNYHHCFLLFHFKQRESMYHPSLYSVTYRSILNQCAHAVLEYFQTFFDDSGKKKKSLKHHIVMWINWVYLVAFVASCVATAVKYKHLSVYLIDNELPPLSPFSVATAGARRVN